MASQTISIDWSLLLPTVSSSLLDSEVTTVDLSAYVIFLMISVSAIAAIYVIVRSLKARKSIHFLISLFDNVSSENLAQQRREISNRASKRSEESALWIEFDETLVESIDGSQVYNTVDAAYFFNTHSLARGVTESRLLAALPGVLTALGVFGTFVGLQLGISGLQFGGADVLQESIPQLINGAAVAFSTSVWGVGTSLIFNVFEKSVEHQLRKRINVLQQRIDYLFPRSSAEQLLTNIEHHNKQSENTLKGLAEQIGGHMQKAIDELGAGVQQGIKDAIGPSIEKLVTAANEFSSRQEAGSERALDGLVTKFADSIGNLGEEQKLAFEKTSADVQGALREWTGSLGGLTGELEERLQGFASQESEREKHFQAQLSELAEHQRSTMEAVGKVLANNLESSKSLIDQGASVNRQAENNNLSIKALSEELTRVSTNLNLSAEKLSSFGSELTQSTSLLSSSQLESAKLVEKAAADSRSVSESAQQLIASFELTNTRVEEVSERLKDSASLASTGFKDLESSYESFITQLAERVKEFGEIVNQMLVDYSDSVSSQTEHRLSEWNTQTQAFSNTLISAVESMGDTLSEVDDLILKINSHDQP